MPKLQQWGKKKVPQRDTEALLLEKGIDVQNKNISYYHQVKEFHTPVNRGETHPLEMWYKRRTSQHLDIHLLSHF